MLTTDQAKPAPAFHAIAADEMAQAVDTDLECGLTSAEARRRLLEDGPNALQEGHRVTFWQVVASQFASLLIVILIVAGAVSLAVGEVSDALVIMAIVVLNAALGASQELRAERALEALMASVAQTARVVRESLVREIPAAQLVRGDLVVLRAGDLVPADVRLTDSHSLSIDESPLTGESMPARKSSGALVEETAAVGDRPNSSYMGTNVAYGRGAGVVVATGMSTELGQIARLVGSQVRVETPLQQKLRLLGKQISLAAVALCAIVFIAGLLRGQELLEMFLVAISLAVAAIPEGLPAVVTIALSLGLQQMLKRHALIRRLAAVETLGAATVICTDKTGTLTLGEMWVDRVYQGGRHYHAGRAGLTLENIPVAATAGSPLHTLLLAAALCNDATLEGTEGEPPQLAGSPTEVALARAALEAGLPDKRDLEAQYPRIAEAPFDSERKRMSTVHRTPDGRTVVFVKGAPDVVLPFCTRAVTAQGTVSLAENPGQREEIEATLEEMASQAYRLLVVACKEDAQACSDSTAEELERDLTFLGLVGLLDPPRPETPEAVAVCSQAGIRTIMVTGDHAQTASVIARSVGIAAGANGSVSGRQLDAMTREELGQAVKESGVFARVSPHHKLRIVEALQDQGEIVAMTGDGSNDAPALKRANIGIAMGIRGTDVSKEAADMVLTDDNFQSIVAAVHQGRVIYSNIRKAVMYLLSCNLGEILAVFVAMVSGQPLLLQPIQILWVNLVTDGLPALALSAEHEEPGIMGLPPRNPGEGILTGRTGILLASQGLIIGAVTLASFMTTLQLYPGDVQRAQTAAFVTLTLSELLRALSFRTELVPVLRQGLFSNRWMVGAMAASTVLLFAVVYPPLTQGWFDTATPSFSQWLYMGPLALLPFMVAEITKLGLIRHRVMRSSKGL